MAIILKVKVIPSSGRSEWKLDKSGIIKCYVKSPPEAGKANKELIVSLSQHLKILQSLIMICQGMTSRSKTIKIDYAIALEDIKKLLHLDSQQMLY